MPFRVIPALLLALASLALAPAGAAAQATPPAPTFANPVIAGQYADPSIVRDGEEYYVSVTTRSWAPIFSLLRSRDLVNWEPAGGVLPRAPRWSAPPYWAPELTAWDDGTTRVYYTARLRERRSQPCIGVASAPRPAGPYRDHGPVICPPEGAIDAVVADDEDGVPWAIYRRWDQAGGIWAQQMSEDGLGTVGDPRQLLGLTDDDDEILEGPAVVRRGEDVFLVFASGNCCRPPCDYRTGVARATRLLGPYLRATWRALDGRPQLRCPGHGSFVEAPGGRLFMVHHAVLPDDPRNARRATALEPVSWDAEGWPVIGDAGRPLLEGVSPFGAEQLPVRLAPSLRATPPDRGWQWPWNREPLAEATPRGMVLGGLPSGAVLARQVAPLDVDAGVTVRGAGGPQCAAGIAAVTGAQDAGQAIGVERTPRGTLRVWRGKTGGGAGTTLRETPAPGRAGAGRPLTLGLAVRGSRTVQPRVMTGGRWRALGRAVRPTSANHRLIRIALTCRGSAETSATFDALRIAER